MCWKYFKKYYCWYRKVVLYLYIFRLFVVLFVRVLVGQTWPSSLNIISTAFNCSHDTESEYIWLWFMCSYLYSSIWYFKKEPPFGSLQYSWQHTLINAEHLKDSALNVEVLLGVINHGLMISFITLTCTDGLQLNKQYDHNDFQVNVPDSIGVSKIYLSMYVWFVTLPRDFLFSGNIYIISKIHCQTSC
jgi:hypothetical protein